MLGIPLFCSRDDGSGGRRTFAKKFAMYRGLNRVNVFVDL